MVVFVFLLVSLSTTFSSFTSQKVIPFEVTITNIRSEKGQFVIGVYKDALAFEKEKASEKLVIKKQRIKDGMQKITIYLEPGIYGISMLDDEDNNQKMNYNMIGLPTEGFGFLNYYHSGLRKPSFDDFKLKLSPETNVPLSIKLRYI